MQEREKAGSWLAVAAIGNCGCWPACFAASCRKVEWGDADRPRVTYFCAMTQTLELAPETVTDRPLWPAMGRGWRRFCPSCGGGPIFDSYLKVRHSCASCGEELFHHRADDIPTWAVLMIVCNLMGVGLLFVEFLFSPPIWVHWALWPALMLPLTLWLLPRVKGSVVGLQWSQRMHGFGGQDTKARISGQSPAGEP